MTIDLNQPLSSEDLDNWKDAVETETLEFKTAENNFPTEELGRYCCALANEGGGRIVFGMTPNRPRQIVGSKAFPDLERTRSDLIRDLKVPIRVDEVAHPNIARPGVKVVIFSVDNHRPGEPVAYKGHQYGREGDGLGALSHTKLRAIFDELASDFSAQICPGATIESLDLDAIELFRQLWFQETKNKQLLTHSQEQLLRAAELLNDKGLTYAALLLLGTRAGLTEYLPQAEIIWEYRSKPSSVPYDLRENFREGFLIFHEKLWQLIKARNYPQPIQRGFVMIDILPFNERSTREAIANAIIHRDYRSQDSIFVRQTERSLIVTSPGGFPNGVTIENILGAQSPRNRRLAEAAERCDLIERSGQGVDLMFENAVKEAKLLPDYSVTTSTSVHLKLDGEVQDPQFLLFLEQAGSTLLEELSTEDFLVLNSVNRHLPLSERFSLLAEELLNRGLLEKTGRGKGRRFILSQRLCEAGGSPASYTRSQGLERQTRKQLFLQQIRNFNHRGSTLAELHKIEPSLTYYQAREILKDLRRAKLIEFRKLSKQSGRWFIKDESP